MQEEWWVKRDKDDKICLDLNLLYYHFSYSSTFSYVAILG